MICENCKDLLAVSDTGEGKRQVDFYFKQILKVP